MARRSSLSVDLEDDVSVKASVFSFSVQEGVHPGGRVDGPDNLSILDPVFALLPPPSAFERLCRRRAGQCRFLTRSGPVEPMSNGLPDDHGERAECYGGESRVFFRGGPSGVVSFETPPGSGCHKGKAIAERGHPWHREVSHYWVGGLIISLTGRMYPHLD